MVTPRGQRYYMGSWRDIRAHVTSHKRIIGRVKKRYPTVAFGHVQVSMALLEYFEGWLRGKGYVPKVFRSRISPTGVRSLKVRALIRGRMRKGKPSNLKDLRQP